MASGEMGVPTKMMGVITDRTEEGYIATMTEPQRVAGVFLPAEVQFTTREYPNDDARVRITSHPVPETDTELRRGTPVVAHVAATESETVSGYTQTWRRFETVRMLAGTATRWGTTTKKP